MEITKEILELAALAIGETVECTEAEFRGCDEIGTRHAGVMLRGVQIAWRPHTDIADAARLAVKLGIIVQPCGEIHVVHAWVTGWKFQCVREHVRHDGTHTDKERAYCHAITLCAAEIGRRMKEAK